MPWLPEIPDPDEQLMLILLLAIRCFIISMDGAPESLLPLRGMEAESYLFGGLL